jgi:hypothetical protein
MKNSILLLAALAVFPAANALAADSGHVVPLAAPDTAAHPAPQRRLDTNGVAANVADASTVPPMDVIHTAGISGLDSVVAFYVDLDPGPGIRDFNCGRLTFDTHTGHDPYIRSFSEQHIGVPVYAVRDGRVIDVHDGEPDENTLASDPTLRANYVTIRHSEGEDDANEVDTQYVHLRSGIPVAKGDVITAGTQIGLIGSSGRSSAPHIHFEMTVDHEPVEPMAGPCRPGASLLPHQEQKVVTNQPLAMGATFSRQSFGDFRPAPFDDAPHTGTFLTGQQTIYFKAELANVLASTSYQLTLDPPGAAGDIVAASGQLVNYDASFFSIWWGLDVNLFRTGTWTLKLNADGQELLSAPFTVVSSEAGMVNRAPNPFGVVFEAPVAVPNRVPVCRVEGDRLADPDYDVVSYHYTWTVDGAVVRDLTSAARTDALARQLARPGTTLGCTVTASDGKVATQPVTAFARIEPVRRRAVAK